MNKLLTYLKSVSDRDTWLFVGFFCLFCALGIIAVEQSVIIEILNAILKSQL
jgi:hypothetical protein